MRRLLRVLIVPLAAGLLLTGCGDQATTTPDRLTPLDAISQVGAKTTAAGSSKFVLTTSTKAGDQTIEFGGEGAFDYATKDGQLSFEIPGLGQKIELRIVAGIAYLQVPQQPGFYSISLKDLAGTSFGAQADPTSGLDQLKGASEDVTEVGKETIRGTETTHYTGTLDLQKAATNAEGSAKALIEKNLAKLTETKVPFDAYLDDEGRMRKFSQTLKAKDPKVGAVESVVTIELFDFGTEVKVVAPPAAEVRDGTALLKQFGQG